MKIPLRAAFATLLAVSAAAQGLDPSAPEDPSVQRRRTPVVDVVERARPAVVSIDSNIPRLYQDWWGNLFSKNQPVSGTGVVIMEDGFIVTNNHVVASGSQVADRIQVRFDEADDTQVYQAQVISNVPQEDLALIKIEGAHTFPTIHLSDHEPMLGETVIAIGNAVGQTHTVSTGIISGLHRDITVSDGERNLRFSSLIQTDAAINPGNSGGPLLDINGELVGINTAMRQAAENIGFAIPVARVQWVLTNYLLSGRSYLGCTIDDKTFALGAVFAGGPAASAGLHAGDRLVTLAGKELSDADSLASARLSMQAGERFRLAFLRGGARKEAEIEPWSIVEGAIHEHLGVRAEEIQVGRRYRTYVQLAWVDPDGPAGRIGLRQGDVIAAVQPRGWPKANQVSETRDLALLLSRTDPSAVVQIEVWRDDDHDGSFERNNVESELFQGTLVLR